jgi:hypothetical protein
MSYFATNQITGNTAAAALTVAQPMRRPSPIPMDVGQVCAAMGTLIFASGVNLAVNDVIELAILPSDCVPIDFILSADQFDSNGTPTLAGNIGVMTGSPGDVTRIQTAVGSTFGAAVKWGSIAGCTARAGQSNGTAAALTLVQYAQTLSQLGSTSADRSIGMAITALAATNPATIRRLDFTLFYRPAVFSA